jgi:MT0933-like antitoxin protein
VGFLDQAKKSLSKAVDQHGDKIERGADQLGRAINERTGNKHAGHVGRAREQLRKGLKSLDGKDGDGRKP